MLRGLFIEWRRAKIIGRTRRIFGVVIVDALLWSNFNNWQRFAVQDADCHFAPDDLLLDENARVKAHGFSKGLAPIRNALDELHANAGSLANGLDHDRRLIADWPTGGGVLDHSKARGRDARRNASFLRENFIKSDAAGFRTAAGIRDTELFQT